VCESELGHERQGIALVDSIAADLDAPRPKESVAGVAAITIAAASLSPGPTHLSEFAAGETGTGNSMLGGLK
jgi:hypothetical protein